MANPPPPVRNQTCPLLPCWLLLPRTAACQALGLAASCPLGSRFRGRATATASAVQPATPRPWGRFLSGPRRTSRKRERESARWLLQEQQGFIIPVLFIVLWPYRGLTVKPLHLPNAVTKVPSSDAEFKGQGLRHCSSTFSKGFCCNGRTSAPLMGQIRNEDGRWLEL